MKTRSTLPDAEIEKLYAAIGRRLDGICVETQPEVAARILALVADPGAGLRQYSAAIRPDASLTGRLLRVANSAYFAQRTPVTTTERACVLLGLERLKSVSLGFYLCRAAAGDTGAVYSRRIWGESVYRGCLAAELARYACPSVVSEAFVVGLMLDAGLPLLQRLLGAPFEEILAADEPPPRQFKLEFETLPYTHVDVVATLVRRWRLPDLLARPIERHHTPPAPSGRTDGLTMLERIAYYAGAVRLERHAPSEPAPLSAVAERDLGIQPDRLMQIIRRAGSEYAAMAEAFRDAADSIGDPSSVADTVHQQLVEVVDSALISGLKQEAMTAPEKFIVGEHTVEIEPDHDGRYIAYLNDSSGGRLSSFTFRPGEHDAAVVLDSLGVDAVTRDDAAELEAFLRSRAA